MKRFWKNSAGNFAVMAAVTATPLILTVGAAVDGSRYYAAQTHLQGVADSLSLALAASTEQDEEKLRELADGYLAGNVSKRTVENARIASFSGDEDEIDVTLVGDMPVTFMRLAGYDRLDVGANSLAKRSPITHVEIALVLDNTWSMSEKDSGGISRIDTLKEASSELIEALYLEEFEEGGSTVQIGIVPYADYVNVGKQYRSESWLDVPADEPAVAATCEPKLIYTENYCAAYGPYYPVTSSVDGVEETSQRRDCIDPRTRTLEPPKQSQTCSGGKAALAWYGCVGSRTGGLLHVNDLHSNRYPGFIATGQRCLNPLVPLTDDKTKLLKTVKDLIINIGGYKPYTYIPSGLIWGVNLLSPSAPFTEAAEYDVENINPRKVLILMTDGDNTRRLTSNNGQHVGLSSKAADAETQVNKTNADTQAICDYAKSHKIEIYTVAFMVDNAKAKTLLQACATDESYYYDATDRAKLLSAFSGIARSINQVRLAR